MNVNGEYRLPASRERVWDALRDPETLRACIPGCVSAEKLSDKEFEVVLTAQVGAVGSTFTGRLTLADEDHPRGWAIAARLESPNAGFADGQASLSLTAEGKGCVLGYRARLEPGGRLASVGSRLLHGVAIRTANEFFVRLIERLAPPRPGAAPQELAEPVPVTMPTRAVTPIAPAAVVTPGPAVPGKAGQPKPEAEAVPGLSYQAEVNPRTQRIVIACGFIMWIVVVLVILSPWG